MVRRPALLLALLLLVPALALAGCAREPAEADPAIWRVKGADGQEAWLFGTIHAAERPIAWRTPPVAQALDAADEIMVEVSNIADEAAVSAVFVRLATTPGQPPLSQRVEPERRAALMRYLDRHHIGDGDFAATETWAAALMLAQADSPRAEARNGIDRAVIAAAKGRPVVELEGAAGQLALFDALPEAEQRDLLDAVVADPDVVDSDDEDIAGVWRRGDMVAIERETRRGLMADPELRAALFTGRNQRWIARITGEMARGRRPFVAVGAAHMAGPEGLPALLASRGYKVTRLR
ncbi:TraB/GumN family protein [Novosphingobium album (ex Liu et al. 2023)]|uniref:TraB/GumN family protein n=1 Tax=Novosphingobium album (ex Liu et al. 2023) TaxID=3031130 RepID=A0ABT5WKV6_9SPHN|nr:TraB/GumN family protein [Novosphingobium album (ex Liu et al. 2023)]MDE8650676.1 TraB/GumN family protein [Novosphingobium album (ex Liu et al. 2023)]